MEKIASEVAVRGDGVVAGVGRVVGVPKFHSWGKCTMLLTNINSDWMSNTSSELSIILPSSFKLHLGCNKHDFRMSVLQKNTMDVQQFLELQNIDSHSTGIISNTFTTIETLMAAW